MDLSLVVLESKSKLCYNLRLFSIYSYEPSVLYDPVGGVLVLLAITESLLFLLIDLNEHDCLIFQGLLIFCSDVNFLNLGLS